jgi:hypothetical protein
MGIGWDWFDERVRLCVNLCPLLDNNLCLPLDNNLCLLLDNNIGLRWDYVFCWTLPLVDIFYLIGMLDNNLWVKYRWFSAFNLIIPLPLILYHAYHFFLHLLSTNHKYTQPCYFLLLYKPAAQKLKEILNSSMRSSRRVITPGWLPVELWYLSAAMLLRVLDLVFCKTLFEK